MQRNHRGVQELKMMFLRNFRKIYFGNYEINTHTSWCFEDESILEQKTVFEMQIQQLVRFYGVLKPRFNFNNFFKKKIQEDLFQILFNKYKKALWRFYAKCNDI